MADRILKDIRYYESENQNIEGESMPHHLGRLFKPTKDTNYIGQRIARKLNELKFSYGEFDHLYINLTTVINENQIVVSNRNVDKTIKYIDYGLNPGSFNSLADPEKNDFIKHKTIEILKSIAEGENVELVNQTESLLSMYDTEMKIHFKTKETKSYRIDIYYQIEPISSYTKAIVDYEDRQNNQCYRGTFKLQYYDHIYFLADSISIKDDLIVLNPKKSFQPDLYSHRYETPFKLKLAELEKISCSK